VHIDVRLMNAAHEGYGQWFNSSLNAGHDIGSFSAVCYLTALQMKKIIPGHADRPIGLIQASVGGASIYVFSVSLCHFDMFLHSACQCTFILRFDPIGTR
jgi:hypothetical protein